MYKYSYKYLTPSLVLIYKGFHTKGGYPPPNESSFLRFQAFNTKQHLSYKDFGAPEATRSNLREEPKV